ncbi:MAG: M48 family metallopeptidase [Asgard group archaeon]|nr:M48 family metallopeptidase [Asgard group archaeon]
MNIYLIITAVLIGLEFLIEIFVDILNMRHIDPELPEEFEGFLDREEYERSQLYLQARTKFSLVLNSFLTAAWISFLLSGGLRAVNSIFSSLDWFPSLIGLLYLGIIAATLEIIRIPFSIYMHFGLEEKFGFNRMTAKTFIFDLLKRWMLGILLGGGALYGIFSMFYQGWTFAWLYNWLIAIAFIILFMYLAPVIFLPLTFKFTPLEEGELRNKIEHYAEEQDYPLEGIYTVDASRRTTKSNALFVGFGKLKRIALFDNLVEKQEPDEIVSVVAHELGHNRKHHILYMLLQTIFSFGIFFYLYQLLVLDHTWLLDAFNLPANAFYIGFLIMFLLIAKTPLTTLISWFQNSLQRRFEYQSDAYSIETYDEPEALINALKKLSVNNLSNLTPHPLKITLEYDHPPVLKRIEHVRKISEE